jgi:DNA-binding FadR family transcriptional regulator
MAALRHKDPEGARRAIERAIAIGTDRLNEAAAAG